MLLDDNVVKKIIVLYYCIVNKLRKSVSAIIVCLANDASEHSVVAFHDRSVHKKDGSRAIIRI